MRSVQLLEGWPGIARRQALGPGPVQRDHHPVQVAEVTVGRSGRTRVPSRQRSGRGPDFGLSNAGEIVSHRVHFGNQRPVRAQNDGNEVVDDPRVADDAGAEVAVARAVVAASVRDAGNVREARARLILWDQGAVRDARDAARRRRLALPDPLLERHDQRARARPVMSGVRELLALAVTRPERGRRSLGDEVLRAGELKAPHVFRLVDVLRAVLVGVDQGRAELPPLGRAVGVDHLGVGARPLEDAIPRAERIVALVAIVIAGAEERVSPDCVRAREIVVGNVALAVLHREGVGLREPIIQEQLLYTGDVDVHALADLPALLVFVEALVEVVAVIHSARGDPVAECSGDLASGVGVAGVVYRRVVEESDQVARRHVTKAHYRRAGGAVAQLVDSVVLKTAGEADVGRA